jgi:hypothetical protein
VFGGGDCFGTQRRNPLTFCQLRHSISDEAHRWDEDRFGQDHEASPELSSTFTGPTSGEGSAPGTYDTLAEPHVVESRGGQFVRRDEPAKVAPLLTGEDIAQ